MLDTGGTGKDGLDAVNFASITHRTQNDPSNFRVAFRDHFHAVCPTGPSAACLKLTALRKPNPPAARGRDAVSRADQCTVVESTPTREQKHSQIWLSWRVANEWGQIRADGSQEKIRSRNTAAQQEDPRTLQNPEWQGFSSRTWHVRLPNSLVPTGVPKMVIPLRPGSLWGSPLHTLASGCTPLSDCLQKLGCRRLSTLVENASLALIQTYSGMFPQLFGQDVVAIHCAVWSRQRMQIIKESHVEEPHERKQLVSFFQVRQPSHHGVSGDKIEKPQHHPQTEWLRVGPNPRAFGTCGTRTHTQRGSSKCTGGSFHCFANLLSDRASNQASKCVAHNDPSHTSISFA